MAVNDRADIAGRPGADVLHLGQDDLPLAVARDIVGPATLIGRSTHETGEAARATDGGRRLLLCRPLLAHAHQARPAGPGLDLVRAVASMNCDKPWFAIGGIDEQRLGEVLEAGPGGSW